MTQVNISVAKAHLSELIQKVLSGEEIIIARNNKPMVKLVVIKQLETQRTLGSGKNLVVMTPDFNAALDDFKDY